MTFFREELGNNTGKLKLFVHLIVPLLLSLTALAGALLKVYGFDPNDWDYGIFSNLLWNFAHGNGWRMSLYEGQARVLFLADHLALLVPLLAPFFILFPSPYTFSVLHGLAFSAVFFLVPFFVREVWKHGGRDDYLPAALFLMLALLNFPGFWRAWSYQSHMTTLVMPFLLASLIALHRKSLVWAVLFCLIVTLAQERASVALFGVGMYALFITKNHRLGLALCIFSTVYFFAAIKLAIPFFSGQGYLYSDAIQPFHDLDRKAWFLSMLFLFWFFLPLIGKRAFLAACCALPLLGLGLVSNREPMYSLFWAHYNDLPSIFFLAAATFGVLRLSEEKWFQQIPRAVVTLLACACLLISFAYFVSIGTSRLMPVSFLATWRPDPAIAQLNADLAAYSRLHPDVKVYASSGIGPRLSMRKHRYVLTLEAAEKHFNASMVFIAPNKGMYPYRSREEIVSLLRFLASNQSLRLTKQTSDLLVFTSTDLLTDRGQRILRQQKK